jgi:hypothetical protein
MEFARAWLAGRTVRSEAAGINTYHHYYPETKAGLR